MRRGPRSHNSRFNSERRGEGEQSLPFSLFLAENLEQPCDGIVKLVHYAFL